MRSPLILCLLLATVYRAQCSYVAIAPKVFHPGWKYSVMISADTGFYNGQRVSVTGNIFNGKKQSLGAGVVSFDNGQSAMLEIQVIANLKKDPDNRYSLQLDGSGALSFSNSTSLQLAPLSRLAFIQTDRTVYATGQLIRFRVLIVDEDLRPLYIPKNITIMNSMDSRIARFFCNGSKAVYENTYQLAEFPDFGNWHIAVQSTEGNIDERVKIRIVENVTTDFDVSAEVTPDLLIKESGENRYVTLKVTARELSGKGVKGDIKVTVVGINRSFRDRITESSGEKKMQIDLSRELAVVRGDRLTLLVDVTDSTSRKSSAQVSVGVTERPVIVYFDLKRMDRAYRTGMPFVAQLKITDARGQSLPQDDLGNQVELALTDHSNSSNTVTSKVTLTPGQTEITLNLTKVNSTTSELKLTASFVVKGRKYEDSETIRKYRVLGNGTLNARWIGPAPNLTMGDVASFIVDVGNATNYTAVTYMIVSRGSIQTFGRATPGQIVRVKVTPHMCPKGRLVVYGLTEVNDPEKPELIADGLPLTTQHCQGKRIQPKLNSNNLEAGSNVALTLDVQWTDPEEQRTKAVDHHDVYVMAVDKRAITLQGEYDVNPTRVEEGLKRLVANASQQQGQEQGRRRKRSSPQDVTLREFPTSTGALFECVGLTVLGDVNLLEPGSRPSQNTEQEDSHDNTQIDISDRTHFPDTWLWKTSRTDDRGKLTLVETLPDSVTKWVISAFAVRKDSELALTSEPLELDVSNKFYVQLNLPRSVRRGEKLEVRATVFNYDLINMDTTVILAPSDNYIISGGASESVMVKRNQAGTVTFTIVANKIETLTIRVTATAQRSNGATVTDTDEQLLTVKSSGVFRRKVYTFPVMLSETKQPFDRNLTLDLSPWSKKDVIDHSRTLRVMVTGDLMGNVMNNLRMLVRMPTGCGEQNLMSMVGSIQTMCYLTATDLLHLDIADRAKQFIREGYTRQVQQYRWNNGGFSPFGSKDQTASTWLTAFTLKSFAKARVYVRKCVDIDIVDSAVQFLYTRQNMGTGQFSERGRVIQEEMQDRAGGTDALTAFVTISLLEAKKRGIKIQDDNLHRAVDKVKSIGRGSAVRNNPFLAALTSYALALHDHDDYSTQETVLRLIGYVETRGAPWKKRGVTSDDPKQMKYASTPSTLDVQVTAYFLLTLNALSKFDKAKDLLMWLVRNQNCIGGYRSTQDTMIAVQAIAEHAPNLVRATSYNDVVVTALSPSAKPRSVRIDSTNSAVLQTVELPSETSKMNIYVTGDAKTLAVVKVVLTFNTGSDTTGKAFNKNNDHKINLSTRTNMERPGQHTVQACISPESGLDYRSMVVLCLGLPSGFEPKDLKETRDQNPVAVRVESWADQVRFYMYQPRKECINMKIQEKVKVDDLRPGCSTVFAYYMPDIRSEDYLHIGCPDGSCSCTTADCTGRAAPGAQLSMALLFVCLAALLSLIYRR